MAGLYPIALDFGAVGERIAASRVGTLLPHASTPAEINAAILSEITRAAQWPVAVDIGGDCDDILADYYGLSSPELRPGRSSTRSLRGGKRSRI